MPKQINTPQPGQRLVNEFATKGRYQPVLDEVIVPVAIVSDLTDTAPLQPGTEQRAVHFCQKQTSLASLFDLATMQVTTPAGIFIQIKSITGSKLLSVPDVDPAVALAPTWPDGMMVSWHVALPTLNEIFTPQQSIFEDGRLIELGREPVTEVVCGAANQPGNAAIHYWIPGTVGAWSRRDGPDDDTVLQFNVEYHGDSLFLGKDTEEDTMNIAWRGSDGTVAPNEALFHGFMFGLEWTEFRLVGT